MKLTKRESEVCKYLILGLKNIEIAQEMHLSKHTIKAYISTLISSFDVKNRTELAYILGKRNII